MVGSATGTTFTSGVFGMGFQLAMDNGSGAPTGLMTTATAATNTSPLRYIFNKRTDPLGSPGTSQVTTLTLRGNTVPHTVAAPAVGGDFANAGPAQVMVKKEIFFRTELRIKPIKERERPYYVQNDSYYDTVEANFLNFFKTSPAQAAPVTSAQI
jgi:hypothetical protein